MEKSYYRGVVVPDYHEAFFSDQSLAGLSSSSQSLHNAHTFVVVYYSEATI